MATSKYNKNRQSKKEKNKMFYSYRNLTSSIWLSRSCSGVEVRAASRWEEGMKIHIVTALWKLNNFEKKWYGIEIIRSLLKDE